MVRIPQLPIYKGFQHLRPRGFNWDNGSPSTAVFPRPINLATGRNVISAPSPSVEASRSSVSARRNASGAKTDRIERNKVMALAQAREIDAILVTELSRWGRSTIDLVQTLQSLQAWDVSVLAVSGLQFDLSTPHGKMIASVMAALAEFERDLIRERIKSGIAAAKATRQAARSPTGSTAIGSKSREGDPVGRGWSELPVDWSPSWAQQKYRCGYRPAGAGRLSSWFVQDVVHSEHFRVVTPHWLGLFRPKWTVEPIPFSGGSCIVCLFWTAAYSRRR